MVIPLKSSRPLMVTMSPNEDCTAAATAAADRHQFRDVSASIGEPMDADDEDDRDHDNRKPGCDECAAATPSTGGHTATTPTSPSTTATANNTMEDQMITTTSSNGVVKEEEEEEEEELVNEEVNDSGDTTSPKPTTTATPSSSSTPTQQLAAGLKLVDGCVEPPFDPPSDKPLRFTNQLQYLRIMLTKYLCRYKAALPFLAPVNCIKLKIPDYYEVVTNPMDLQTIKRRLMFLWYDSARDCLSDFKLMFSNCYKFNDCDNFVYNAGKKLEQYLEDKLKDMPKEELEIKPCPEKPTLAELERRANKRRSEVSTQDLHDSELVTAGADAATTSSSSSTTSATAAAGGLTPSSVTVNGLLGNGFGPKRLATRSAHGIQLKRPVRELPGESSVSSSSALSSAQPRRVPLNTSMKFCLDIIKELLTKKHRDYAWPFYEPVSLQQFPDYLEFVKKPIDLNTIKTKIETGQYRTVKDYVKDMRLMISNCYRYNKPEAPIMEQARKLRDYFEYRYAKIPEEFLKEKLNGAHNSHQNTTGGGGGHQQQHNNSHNNSRNNNHNSNSNNHNSSSNGNDSELLDKESQLRMKLLESQVKLLTNTISLMSGLDVGKQLSKQTTKSNNNNNNNGGIRRRNVNNGNNNNKSSKKSSSKRSAATPKKTAAKKRRQQQQRQQNRQIKQQLSDDDDDDDDEDQEEEDSDDDEDRDSDDSDMAQTVPSPVNFQFDDMDDLQLLKTDLENLDAKDLKNVLRILRSTEPSIKCDNDENIEIDFEALKPETLVALRKFVSSCMLNSKPVKKSLSSKCMDD
ncbi:bromodomain-containing protein 3-like isoform X2 [Oppia nitens]|uniref:bromodomain-containing protein 3-like isoform X2 n=1 Tax=Oppia nitens TaxID=1686743 RepID=UPI0023D9EE71|nr:bromodomain-containing protein 3-like isoform X2 [Oppia nitens]